MRTQAQGRKGRIRGRLWILKVNQLSKPMQVEQPAQQQQQGDGHLNLRW